MKNADNKRAIWEELSAIVTKIEKKDYRRITPEEIARLDPLYRLATQHLSEAKTKNIDPQLILYLNDLVGRAHQIIYIPPRRKKSALIGFFASGFPRIFRKRIKYVAASMLLFFVHALVSFVAVKVNPTAAYSLWQEQYIHFENERLENLRAKRNEPLENHKAKPEEYRGNFTFSKEASSAISSLIIANNVRVGIFAFAGGILAGSVTIFALIYNGIMLGTLCGVIDNYGFSHDFLTLILTHGIFELFVICVSGGAGLILAKAILFPGSRTRKESLQKEGRDALLLFAGTIPLFIIAGLIEGFITPHCSETFRLVIIASSVVFLLGYFGLAWILPSAGKKAAKA